ncbi:MAG: hypothetical protein VCD00_15870 [Candidatus Hydrogenedentota bacterium]
MAMFAYGTDVPYEKVYSGEYTNLTGYELSETGVHEALGSIDAVRVLSTHIMASISVIGEQQYAKLADLLRDIYQREPIEPDKGALTTGKYRDVFLYEHKIYIARAFVRLGDADGPKYAIEQALDSPRMGTILADYAMQTLKYPVKDYGLDVGTELEYLATTPAGSGEFANPEIAVRELVEIEKYLAEEDPDKVAQYAQIIDRIDAASPSNVKRVIERSRNGAARWKETQLLIEASKESK